MAVRQTEYVLCQAQREQNTLNSGVNWDLVLVIVPDSGYTTRDLRGGGLAPIARDRQERLAVRSTQYPVGTLL